MRRFLLASLLLLTLTARGFADAPLSPPLPTKVRSETLSLVEGLLAHQRVLVLGDSITQDGRYVTFLEYYLHRFAPGAKCDLISIGLSSETMSGLTEPKHPAPRPCILDRLDRALQAVKPQVVLACYGMNDGIYHPSSPARLAAFNTGLAQLIEKVRASGARLVLITPPVFDPRPIRTRTVPAEAPEFGYNHPFVGYDAVLAELAAEETARLAPGITVIDLHTPMAAALATERARDPNFTFSPDGVHPNDTGHLLMARTVAAGLGLTVPSLTPAAELAALRVDPLFALVRDRRALRSEAWLPFVGFTNGATFKSASVAAAEQVVARLQGEIEALAAR